MSGFPRCRRPGLAIIACLLTFSSVVSAQNPSRKPTPPSRTPTPARSRVANLSTTSSLGGSRVSLISDQSLNNYESYRSADRFYVKIPPIDVRSPFARGSGFEDFKVQRSADSTVLSFRLQPGATARVEQQANQLSVIFRTAGASASNPNLTQQTAPGNRQARSSGHQRAAAVPNPANNTNVTRSAQSSMSSGSAPAPSNSPNPNATPASTYQSNSQTSSSIGIASPIAQATPVASRSPTDSGSLRDRLRYLLLLAKLNPIPVVIGLAVIVFLIVLILFRRRIESETRLRVQEEEVLRRAELRIKAIEDEISRIQTRDDARRRATEDAARRSEEETRRHEEEESRRQAEIVARQRSEEEARLRARIEKEMRAEAEARRRAEAEARHRAEEEYRKHTEEEARRIAQEAQERRAAEEEALRHEEAVAHPEAEIATESAGLDGRFSEFAYEDMNGRFQAVSVPEVDDDIEYHDNRAELFPEVDPNPPFSEIPPGKSDE